MRSEAATKLTTGTFLAVGDLQRTSLLEVWRESNVDERKVLVAAIAREKADFLVLLGDLVFRGDSRSDWADFDALTAPLHGLPKLPVLGNHDYGLRRESALREFHVRFPLASTFYERRYGPLLLLFLDSNRSRMPRASWTDQERWFSEALRVADADPAVRAVLTFVHHPPFTNSSVTGDDRDVRQVLVPPFMSARKTLAMVSGHVHSYERFDRGGKVFIVSGGGGGPRARLHGPGRRRHDDDLFRGTPVRPFHFLRFGLREGGVSVDVEGFEKGATSVVALESFELPYERGGA